MADRWLTFDCFGTLIDWRHGIRTTGELLFPGHGPDFHDAYIALEVEVEGEGSFKRYRAVLTDTTRRAAKQLALDLKPDDATALVSTIPYWPPFGDVGPALVELRREGLSVYEISTRLTGEGTPLGRTAVSDILREEGFGRLLRGPAPEASTSPATSGRDTRLPAAAVTDFAALPARTHTTMAGLLLAIPDLVSLDLPALIRNAGYQGTRVIPPVSWLLSLLALKLTRTRRVSHVDDLLDTGNLLLQHPRRSRGGRLLVFANAPLLQDAARIAYESLPLVICCLVAMERRSPERAPPPGRGRASRTWAAGWPRGLWASDPFSDADEEAFAESKTDANGAFTRAPVTGSQTRTVPSALAVTSCLPSRE